MEDNTVINEGEFEMDHRYIDDRNIVDLYVIGKLSPREAARFEIHFINCEQCVRQLDATESMRLALKEAGVARAARARRPAPAWLVNLRGWRSAAVVAALVALALVPSVLLFREVRALRAQLAARDALLAEAPPEDRTPPGPAEIIPPATSPAGGREPPRSSQRPQANQPLFVLSAMRGGEANANPVVIDRASQWVVLSVEIEGEANYPSYRATLSTDRRTVWRDATLRPNRYRALTIGLPPSFLTAGNYVLTVEGLSAGGAATPVGNYLFSVKKKP
jgi:hypothetical protein